MPDTILAPLFGLVGVLVGGLITFLTASAIETQKWKQQMKERRAEDMRATLRKTAEWIGTVEFAVSRAQAAAGQGAEVWFRLVTELGGVQGDLADVFLLGPDLQQINSVIVQQLGCLQLYEETQLEERSSQERLLTELTGLRKLAGEFRRRLKEQYNATYEWPTSYPVPTNR